MNKITFGVNQIDANVAGKTVLQVANETRGLLNLPEDNSAIKPYIDGQEVDWGTTVLNGQTVKFDRPMGGKGAANAVSFGVNRIELNVAGKTVGDIYNQSRALLNLPEDRDSVVPYVDGQEASFDTVVLADQEVKFDRPMGGKGN